MDNENKSLEDFYRDEYWKIWNGKENVSSQHERIIGELGEWKSVIADPEEKEIYHHTYKVKMMVRNTLLKKK